MLMSRRWLFVTVVCAISIDTGCTHQAPVGSTTPASVTNNAPANSQPKVAQKLPQAAIDMQIYQINQSKLPDAEKQRLISQVRASAK